MATDSLIGRRIKYKPLPASNDHIGRVLYYYGDNRFMCIFPGDVKRLLHRTRFEVIK